MNNNINPILAQSFLRVQGVCLPDTGYVLSYIEDVRTGKNNAVIVKKNRQNTSQWSMIHQKTQKIPNKANLNIILTWITNEIKRTYSDFYKKDVKKTKPILTFS